MDKVLDYKQQVLDAIQAEHAAALAAVQRQEDHLASVWQRYREYNDEFCQNKAVGLTVTEALMYESGLRGQELVIQRETRRLEDLKEKEERARARMVEAKVETSSLEKLKEKKLDEYNKAVQKSEEALIDEFVSNKRAAAAGNPA